MLRELIFVCFSFSLFFVVLFVVCLFFVCCVFVLFVLFVVCCVFCFFVCCLSVCFCLLFVRHLCILIGCKSMHIWIFLSVCLQRLFVICFYLFTVFIFPFLFICYFLPASRSICLSLSVIYSR